MTNRERIAQIVSVHAKYYNRDLSEIEFAIYIEDLGSHPAEAVSAAFAEHRRDPSAGKFMPKTGEILARLQGAPPDAVDQKLAAWDEVMAAMRTSFPKPFSPHVAKAVAMVGGIRRIGMAREGWELDQLRLRFMEALQPIGNASVLRPLPPPVQVDDCAD